MKFNDNMNKVVASDVNSGWGPPHIFNMYKLLYYLSKPLAMAPYSVRRDPGNGKYYVKKQRVGFLHICLIIALGVITLRSTYSNLEFIEQLTPNNYGVLTILSFGRVIGSLMITVMFLIRQDYFIQALEELYQVDRILAKLGSPITYGKFFKNVNICSVFGILLIFATEVIAYYVFGATFKRCAIQVTGYGLPFLITIFMVIYFNGYNFVVLARLKEINRILINLQENETRTEKLQELGEAKIETLRQIMIMHTNLCRGTKYMNHVFSYGLFHVVFGNFIEIVHGIYAIVYKMEGDFDRVHSMNVLYLIHVYCALAPPVIVENEATTTTKLLGHLDVFYFNKGMANARNSFLLQTLHESIKFTACGFFPLSVEVTAELFNTSLAVVLLLVQIQGGLFHIF